MILLLSLFLLSGSFFIGFLAGSERQYKRNKKNGVVATEEGKLYISTEDFFKQEEIKKAINKYGNNNNYNNRS